ncbi:hypothetical protein AAVH_23496 [Aphelenchoides avenae]|nr:hypothetical protein AAVH_23496 [Aphelenchus avenae]
MSGAKNATPSALPAIQGEIDAICKDLRLSVDHLDHGDLAGMYAGLREVVSGKERRLLAFTPDTWAFGTASSEPVRMDSTIVDAEGRRFAPVISLSSAQTLNQMSTGTLSPVVSMTHPGAATMHMPLAHPRNQENMASSSTHMQPAQTRVDPNSVGQQNPRPLPMGMGGMMQHASQLQLSFNCPDLAADCEVVCLATARLQDGDRFLAKSTLFVAFAGATPFCWKFASGPVNMAMAKPVCHVKLRPMPLSVADVVEKMDRLEELLGQEEYEWRLMSLKQEFAAKVSR